MSLLAEFTISLIRVLDDSCCCSSLSRTSPNNIQTRQLGCTDAINMAIMRKCRFCLPVSLSHYENLLQQLSNDDWSENINSLKCNSARWYRSNHLYKTLQDFRINLINYSSLVRNQKLIKHFKPRNIPHCSERVEKSKTEIRMPIKACINYCKFQ